MVKTTTEDRARAVILAAGLDGKTNVVLLGGLIENAILQAVWETEERLSEATSHAVGLVGMDLLKLALMGVVAWLLWRLWRRYQPWQVWLATLCLAVPALAVAVLNSLTIHAW